MIDMMATCIDLAKNRTETINLASKNPEIVSNLEKIWDERWGKKK